MNRQQGENKISKILKEDETSPLGEGNINIWYDQFKVLFANFDPVIQATASNAIVVVPIFVLRVLT